MNYSVPRVVKDRKDRYYVVYYVHGKRHRVSNGNQLGLNLYPNRATGDNRKVLANKLLIEIQTKLETGEIQSTELTTTVLSAICKIDYRKNHKATYIQSIEATISRFIKHLRDNGLCDMSISRISTAHCIAFLHSVPYTPSSFNRERKHIGSLFNRIMRPMGLKNPVEAITKMQEKPSLHKPFRDVNTLLEDTKSFNENLFLCCLLTYGCLLRPHQEIRNLKWGDFSEDMKHISLSVRRNKSGRNRIVPLNPYILQYLNKGEDTINIFTSEEKPFNKDYFKTLWSRYKAQSNVLEELQTLYSFRHSGAIEIYKRTGSLTTLQSAMGHASLAVTLGYLRGLEIPKLKLSDMPRL